MVKEISKGNVCPVQDSAGLISTCEYHTVRITARVPKHLLSVHLFCLLVYIYTPVHGLVLLPLTAEVLLVLGRYTEIIFMSQW